ncbi:MAG TPA: response regulator, partial [Burkholderiaceae bacterium]
MKTVASPQILIVEDDPSVRTVASQTLELAGFAVQAVDSAEAALARLSVDWPGIVVSDVRMPNMDGHELHRRCKVIDSELPVILITGHGDVSMA